MAGEFKRYFVIGEFNVASESAEADFVAKVKQLEALVPISPAEHMRETYLLKEDERERVYWWVIEYRSLNEAPTSIDQFVKDAADKFAGIASLESTRFFQDVV
jgi:hypothetical protein